MLSFFVIHVSMRRAQKRIAPGPRSVYNPLQSEFVILNFFKTKIFLFLPGLGTGCAAGVCVFRADAPSFKRIKMDLEKREYLKALPIN